MTGFKKGDLVLFESTGPDGVLWVIVHSLKTVSLIKSIATGHQEWVFNYSLVKHEEQDDAG